MQIRPDGCCADYASDAAQDHSMCTGECQKLAEATTAVEFLDIADRLWPGEPQRIPERLIVEADEDELELDFSEARHAMMFWSDGD